MKHFVEVEDKECFSALLFTCYDLIRPDVAMEMAWRHNHTDFVMPYMIQFVRQLTSKVAAIDERTKPQVQEEEIADEQGYNAGMMQPVMQIGEPRSLPCHVTVSAF